MGNKITAAKVNSITEPGMYLADDTLYLCVKPSGRRSWIQRLSFKGHRHDIGLGPTYAVSLSEARALAQENRIKRYRGINPLAERRKPGTISFRQAAIDTHAEHAPNWSKRHSGTWMQMLEKHAFPKLGNRPVNEITQSDVLAVLEPIRTKRPETARRVRQRIRTILKYCQSKELVKENVADERIDGAFLSRTKKKGHFRALDYREMPGAYRTIESQFNTLPARLCLQFLILTATRSGEARGAKWSEIDRKSGTWTIPAERMEKTKKPHRIPLSKSALAVLDEAEHLRDDTDLIFPSPANPGKPLSDMVWAKPFVKTGLADRTTVHGFRASFKSWASECTEIPREVIEMALSHEVGNAVEQAYQRSDLLDKRRSLVQQWDSFLHGA